MRNNFKKDISQKHSVTKLTHKIEEENNTTHYQSHNETPIQMSILPTFDHFHQYYLSIRRFHHKRNPVVFAINNLLKVEDRISNCEKRVDSRGIDPLTCRMRSDRSTI